MKKFIVYLIIFLSANVYAFSPLFVCGGANEKPYTFSWDCETTTANLLSGTEVASEYGSPALSSTYAYNGTYSVLNSSATSYYYFTDSSIFDPNGSYTISFYFYGSYTEGYARGAIILHGNGTNRMTIYPYIGGKFRVFLAANSNYLWLTSTDTLNTSAWNKVVVTFDGTSGTQTDITIEINDGGQDSDSAGDVWSTSFTELRMAAAEGGGTSYVDKIRINTN